MRSLSERQEETKTKMICTSLSDLYFFLSVLLLVVVRLNTDATLDTAAKHSQQTVCVCQGPLATRSLLCYTYFTVGEIWLSSQDPLCLLGWLIVLNNQFHWEKLNGALNMGSKHEKNEYMIFLNNVLNHHNSGLTILQKKDDSWHLPIKSKTMEILWVVLNQ